MAKKRKKKRSKLPVEVRVLKSLKGPCPFKANVLDRNQRAVNNKRACRKWRHEPSY